MLKDFELDIGCATTFIANIFLNFHA